MAGIRHEYQINYQLGLKMSADLYDLQHLALKKLKEFYDETPKEIGQLVMENIAICHPGMGEIFDKCETFGEREHMYVALITAVTLLQIIYADNFKLVCCEECLLEAVSSTVKANITAPQL